MAFHRALLFTMNVDTGLVLGYVHCKDEMWLDMAF